MQKIILITFLFFSINFFSNTNFSRVTFCFSSSAVVKTVKKPNPLWRKLSSGQLNRKRVISAALAFPIPGGILGLHRIYLGTKPYVPLVYIFTLGGGLFILPIIDFCILVFNKDIERFENNPRIFMWIDNEKKNPVKQSDK